MKAFGWKDIKEKAIVIGSRRIEIVGLIRNFNYESLRQEVDPIIHFHRVSSNTVHNYISVRINPEQEDQVREFITEQWKILNTNREFSYFYIETEMKRLYAVEDRLLMVVRGFTVLSIIISCLGLFGLSSFIISKKRKEIGIRKVLGANVSGLTAHFSATFMKLVVISFLLAGPLSYYFMQNWLTEFAYKVNKSLFIYIGSLALLILVTILTVAGKTIGAARANPVHALKEE
jgi:putative ABC transport system permease protein